MNNPSRRQNPTPPNFVIAGAPNVTNLAAKLIARDPSLKPTEVKQLIIDRADDVGENNRPMPVIHPKKSMGLLEEKLVKK
ncbi:MAG: hypothetical protein JSW58_00340 [Candidatus Latescibacterota bacterium]|nr:MAG: hypothetical protein JSW58_00340 [Candidatus Latescibacterota bacterium]